MNETILNSVVLMILTAALGLFSAVYLQSRKSRLQQKKDDDAWRSKVDQSLIVLGTQMSPLWAQVQARIASELHHPHERYKEMDTLLEKLESKPSVLTVPERNRLKELLSQRTQDFHEDITPQQRSSAALMLGVMDKVLEETAIASDLPSPTPDAPPFPPHT
jgi:hypothetical protein